MSRLNYQNKYPEIDKRNHFIFQTITKDFSDTKKVKEINYIRKVTITRYERNDDDLSFQIFLSDIQIKSNISIENSIFLKRIAAVFIEIELEVNYFGQIIKIVNLEEIAKRWKIIHAKLATDNIGKFTEMYMQSITNLLKEEKKLITYLSDYKMFGLYFLALQREFYTIEKNKKIIDCGNTLMAEQFYPKDQKLDTYCISATPAQEDTKANLIKYDGVMLFRENQIELATLEIKKAKTTISYNINKTTI